MTRSNDSDGSGIKRGEGVSVWRQIAEDIAGKIATGEWEEGRRLPTETDLAKSYGVNRHTLRRALGDLSRRGLVEASPRRGTFVANARITYPISEQTRFSEIIRAAGRDPGGKLLNWRTTTAPAEMARRLNIAAKGDVIETETLRYANDTPLCWAVSWFPADRFVRLPGLLTRNPSVTAALSQCGVREYRRQETRVSGRGATVKERKMLNLDRGAAVLVVESVNVDKDGEPIQAARSVFTASIVELVFET